MININVFFLLEGRSIAIVKSKELSHDLFHCIKNICRDRLMNK